MAIAAERISARSSTEGDNARLGRTFTVPEATTLGQALGASGLPSIVARDPHPEDPRFRVFERQARQVQGQSSLYEVEVRYKILPPPDFDDGGGNEDDIGFRDENSETRAVIREAWRSDPTRPQSPATIGSGTIDPSVDIGGTSIDAAGNPTSYVDFVQVMAIEQVIGQKPPLALYRTLVGTRNDATFLDADAGRLLYEGAVSTRLGPNKYRVIHRFHWDKWYHARQQPVADQNGETAVQVTGTGQPLRATKVVWFQPFEVLGNFAQLGIQ